MKKNDRYGNLTVVGEEPARDNVYSHKYWKVKCDCGRENLVYEGSLLSGATKTCGNCSGIKDIKIGSTYDKLTVVDGKRKIDGRTRYLCKCSCGNPELKWVRNDYLTGNTKNKGCGRCVEFELIGEKFGRWTVLKCVGKKSKAKVVYYKCKCECGKVSDVSRNLLLNGRSQSCGCLAAEKTSERFSNDLVGQKFGKLTVIERRGSDKGNNAIFLCKCECGKEKEILGLSLKSGGTKSCGCLVSYNPETAKNKRLNTDRKTIGKKNGMLTPTKRVVGNNGQYAYECKCDCGNVVVRNIDGVLAGKFTSCGCHFEREYLDNLKKEMIGKKFNRLTIIDISKKDSGPYALCCCDCGNKKEVHLGHIKSGHTQSCGCAFEELRGENHYNWNPDLTDEERKSRRSRYCLPGYKQWRKKVFKKRGKSCERCGAVSNLHVHHIEPWVMNEDRRFDPSNGYVFCERCHIDYHSIYGYQESNIATLREFMKICGLDPNI